MRTPQLLFALLVLGCPIGASPASFDCANASARVEQLICADRDLSSLDDQLAAEYRSARRTGLPDSEVSTQRAWIAQRNACADADCVRNLYESRIAELREVTGGHPPPTADEVQSQEYVVRCDPKNGVLSIQESGAAGAGRSQGELPQDGEESGLAEHHIEPSELTKAGGSEMQPLRLSAGKKRFQCRLGKSLYRITIEAYIFNARVMGECGAAEPVISADVIRNGQRILRTQRFATCISASRVIHRIWFDERSQSMRVLATLDSNFLPIRIEKAFRFAALPKDLEEAVFEAFPTGDVDVDLFVAVRRRDVERVRESLAKGAAPNARDLRGFTPVAYLWNSGWAPPVRGRTIEQDERDAEEIARLLFGKGASGNVSNYAGVSLLDYLIIGYAPAPVIEMLLQNGADPKSDASLRTASIRGNPVLVERLLTLGADPNKKGPDGSTALWSASSSGFYSWGKRPTPPMDEYVSCVRLLLKNGAKVDIAIRDREGLLWFLVRGFWKDERLKLVLAELIPYSSKSAVKNAYDLSVRIGISQGSADLSAWLGQFVRP